MVESAGFAFHAGGEPSEMQVAAIRDRLAKASAAEATVLGNRELFGKLAADALLPDMERAVRDWSPDFMLREPAEYASAILAAQRDLPTAQVAISLADAEDRSISAAAPALEARSPGLVKELRAAPYLTRFPRSIDPDLFPATHRYREELPAPAGPLPDWWQGNTDPLIYVSLGSVVGRMSIANELYRIVIRAVVNADVRVLLTVGHGFDPRGLGELPTNIHVERWVEQSDVLPFADAVVCHGGSGTVLGALAAGRPLVVVPAFGDQSPNGRHVQAAGAGVIVERDDDQPGPIDDASLARLVEAIRAVRENATFAQRARAISSEIRTAPTVGEILTQLTGQAARPDTR